MKVMSVVYIQRIKRVYLILSPFSEVNPPRHFFSLHVLYCVALFFTQMEAMLS